MQVTPVGSKPPPLYLYLSHPIQGQSDSNGWGGTAWVRFAPARPGRAKTRPFPHGGAEEPTAESGGLPRRFDPLELEWVARSGAHR